MKLNEMQYNGLNILDEISIVELAFDESRETIHVFDLAMAVEPEFNFALKQYELSEGFFKMAAVLKEKQYLSKYDETLEQWIQLITWQFYCSNNKILTLKMGVFEKLQLNDFNTLTEEQLHEMNLYSKYVKRIL